MPTDTEKTSAKKMENSINYAKKNYKRVPLDLRIEEYERLKKAADTAGIPVNTFIKDAIREKIDLIIT